MQKVAGKRVESGIVTGDIEEIKRKLRGTGYLVVRDEAVNGGTQLDYVFVGKKMIDVDSYCDKLLKEYNPPVLVPPDINSPPPKVKNIVKKKKRKVKK